ncbi:MAG: leucyl/phenylalanyl-tRNA--protein transferase [Allosphingosinicella sp.]|uniref:leucyl/phenylalanyl-tRNA--protein transferase n=1 Tax=Allosphingosinicella sp. TaxID=2823234 RepID=UPI0039216DF7
MALIDPELLLRAYAIGVFPMSDSRDAGEIYWVEPRRRAVLPIEGFRLSRSLRKTLRAGRFDVTRDRAFAEVLRLCAGREETWINGIIEDSFVQLHRLGHAHSIECWRDGRLAGGLYGVRLGGAFFGESMFSREADASKVALAWLVARLKVGGFRLLDCQFMTEHLRSLGAVEIPQRDYLQLLSSAVGSDSAAGAGLAAGAGAGAGRGVAAEFGALDRLLAGAAAGADDPASSGCVIAQLLGQTS